MPGNNQSTLEERARRLALPLATKDPGQTIDVVSFSIGQEKYLIESSYVQEITKLRDYTPVPGTPDFVVGVTNIRGEILALVDLRKFFAVPTRGLTDLTSIIVLGTSNPEFGILAQRADQSYAFNRSLLLEAGDNISPATKKYLKGISAEAALFLDGQILLNDERIKIDK